MKKTIEEIASTTPQAMLRDAIKKSGKTLTEISVTAGWHLQNVSSLFHGRSNVTAKTAIILEKAIGAEYLSGEELFLCRCIHDYRKLKERNS
jgi:plasmid maintenance system antidote protein VapI